MSAYVKPRAITSSDIQRQWYDKAEAVSGGETIMVTRQNRPLFYLVPPKAYEELVEAQQRLKRLLSSGGET